MTVIKLITFITYKHCFDIANIFFRAPGYIHKSFSWYHQFYSEFVTLLNHAACLKILIYMYVIIIILMILWWHITKLIDEKGKQIWSKLMVFMP